METHEQEESLLNRFLGDEIDYTIYETKREACEALHRDSVTLYMDADDSLAEVIALKVDEYLATLGLNGRPR